MARMSGKQFDRSIARAYRRRFGREPAAPGGEAPATDPQSRREEIAELAQAVAEEHGLVRRGDALRSRAGRVEPDAIASAAGISLSFGPYGDAFDGMLEYGAGVARRDDRRDACRTVSPGRFHIYANLDRLTRPDSPRARFTLAHELGHYYIDEHRLALASGRAPAHASRSEYESPNAAEQEADHFAAHLLMPPERFLSRARAAPPGLAGVLELAEALGVSLTAAAVQYASLDVRPCAVVKWDWRGFSWKHLSTSAFRAFFRRTFESPADLAEGSPTRLALARKSPPECGYFQAGTVASAWFPGIEPGQWRDAIFLEQAIPLGRFGVLTFLHPEGGARALPARRKTSSGR